MPYCPLTVSSIFSVDYFSFVILTIYIYIYTHTYIYIYYISNVWNLYLVAKSYFTLLRPHGLYLCSQDSPGKNTQVGCHFLLQGIFLSQGLNPRLLHWKVDSFTPDPPGKSICNLGSRYSVNHEMWSLAIRETRVGDTQMSRSVTSGSGVKGILTTTK